MTDSRRFRLLSALCVVFFGTVFILSGCSALKPGSSSKTVVEDQLTTLGQHYSRQNVQRFIRGVHEDYDDGKRNRTDLRYDVSDVSKQYSSLDLTFYGLRTTEDEKSVNVKASWNLRWTCARRDSSLGCENERPRDSSDIVLRRGETTFGFVETEEGYRLISQTGDHIFGSLAPGTVTD